MPATSESARIAMRHKVGSVGNLIGTRTPPATRDHKLDNAKKVRAMSRDVRRKRVESEKPSDPDWKLRQFESIPSRLHQTPKRMSATSPASLADTSTPGPLPRSASTSAISPAKGKAPVNGRSPWARAPLRASNAPIPRPQSAGSEKPRPLNFSPPAREAPREAVEADSPFGKPRRLFGEEEKRPVSRPVECKENHNPGWWPTKGSAPNWKSRPAGRTASAAPKAPYAAEDSDDFAESTVEPPGYRLVSEEERLQTLSELQSKLRELNDRYMRLPLKIETEGHRQQQQALRDKIAQTERAETLFSRPKVLVEI